MSQNIVIRNDGNIPLSGELISDVLRNDGNVSDAWTISSNPESVDELGVGESLVVTITVTPKDNAVKGFVQSTISLSSDGGTLGVLSIDTSVESAEGSEGLFSSLPIYITAPGILLFIAASLIFALRMKKSGELSDSGNQMIAPDAFVNPDHQGTRRNEALDIGHAVDEIASGEVSADEIAAALAQSLEMPAVPSPTALPAGLPPAQFPPQRSLPLGMPPAGLPPQTNLPLLKLPLPVTSPALPVHTPSVQPAPAAFPPQKAPVPTQSGPPLPPTGLPNGWTMEQWKHYGQQWLDRQ